jgi:hypothetical protein
MRAWGEIRRDILRALDKSHKRKRKEVATRPTTSSFAANLFVADYPSINQSFSSLPALPYA